MADIDATTAHLDRLIRCYRAHTLDMGGMDAIVSGAAVLIDEVKRLRAGGCARDQHTTQFCAEAVAKDAEIVRLRTELDDAHKSTAIHRTLNERMAAVLGLTEPHVDPVLGAWPSWHDMPEQVGRLRAELEEARRERLQVGLRAGFDVGALEAERDELRAEVQQRIAHGNALYDAIVRRLAPHFPAGSRDLEWDVLPGTLAALVRERDGARDRLNELTAPIDVVRAEREVLRTQLVQARADLRAMTQAAALHEHLALEARTEQNRAEEELSRIRHDRDHLRCRLDELTQPPTGLDVAPILGAPYWCPVCDEAVPVEVAATHEACMDCGCKIIESAEMRAHTYAEEIVALRARVDGMARNARGTGEVLKAISDENNGLHAQLTRAQRILAVEQGRVAFAPAGWTVRGYIWHKGRLRVRRVGWGWLWFRLGMTGQVTLAAGVADTALEAMELAEASSSAAGGGAS